MSTIEERQQAVIEKSHEIYKNSKTLKGRLKYFAFCAWLAKKGIPIELYSMFERNAGYLNVMTLLKSGYALVDFKNRIIYLNYKGGTIRRFYGSPISLRGACSTSTSFFIHESNNRKIEPVEAMLDIGATDGDLSMIAVLDGVGEVHAYEPYPYAYKLLERNIALNGMESKILPYNEGISAVPAIIHLSDNLKDTVGANLKSAEGDQPVRIITLAEAVKRMGEKKFILKCNVEGHEKDIFSDAKMNSDALRNCVSGQIAWHYKDYPTELIEKMPKYLKVSVHQGDLSILDTHPYTIFLTR